MKFFKCILLFLFWAISSNLFSAELYFVADSDCQGKNGLLVGVEEDRIFLLLSSGVIKEIQKKSIQKILIFGVEANQFKIAKISQNAQSFLKKVSIFTSNKEVDSFLGWPYKFVEDLTFFYDMDGKTRVISENQIYRIENSQEVSRTAVSKAKEPEVYLKEYFPNCPSSVLPSKSIQETGLRPIRILSDKVKIAELLTDYRKGQQYLSNLQDRTFLYPRPYLFEQRARFGIVIENTAIDSTPVLPLYFKWSSGKNYHFQSENIIGGYYSNLGPFVQTTPLIASHFKSHFLNGSFEGNIFGVAAGKDLWGGSLGQDSETAIFPNFNYALVMGFDYKKFRFQFGTIYFNFAFADAREEIYREVLASKSSPIFKLQWTDKNWLAYAVYSRSKYKNESELISDYINQDFSDFTIINDFNYDSSFFRIGAEYDFTDELNLKANFVTLNGEYVEMNNFGTKTLDFTQNALDVTISHRFSYYIAVKARGYSIQRSFNFDFSSDRKVDDRVNAWGGYFELLF